MDEYVRMHELGILPAAGVALVDGEVREKDAWSSPRRWTYDDWERMDAGGILDEGERLELVDGALVQMTPVGDRHIYTVNLLTTFLAEQVGRRAVLQVQSPLKLDTGEGPIPDLALFRMHDDRYRSRRPGPADALLLVEVCDTSTARDREKIELYARAGIPEYWLVNVKRSVVTVYAEPVGGGYTAVREYRHGQAFSSPALGRREVRVEDVLGPA